MLQNATNKKLDGCFEDITRGVANINTDHSAIHLGLGALVADLVTIGGNSVKEYCITGPESLYMHFKNLDIQTTGGNNVKVEILKDASVTVNTGADLTITNPNHNSTTVPETTIKEDPTFTGGDVLEEFWILNDSGFLSASTGSLTTNPNQELVLKDGNEQYILRISNLAVGAIVVSWKAFWYEEPSGLASIGGA